MRRYDAVLLDVDGTLVDSNDMHARAWEAAFAARDLQIPYTRIRMLIGMGGDRLVEQLTGFAPGSRDNKRLTAAHDETLKKRIHEVTPLVGARRLVLQLIASGYRFAIASSSKAADLEPLLRIADVADLCEVRTNADDVASAKPAPDVVAAAVDKLAVDRSRAVLIGDTPYDIESARDAGVATIAVTSGGFSREALAGAIAIFEGPADLVARWASSPLA